MEAIRAAISALVEGQDLDEAAMAAVMGEIMEGAATPAQIGAFLTALRLKGETVAEITGAARVMRAKAEGIPVRRAPGEVLVDTCGTGGDGAATFNVSTTAAFVVAGAGVRVAKHGNRSVSSRSGSADVLEALGVDLSLAPEAVGRAVEEIGIGFLFAPALHPAMKHAIGPRREIGIRTLFNVLGPLTNPAGAEVQLLGVYDPALTAPLAEALGRLGAARAWVVHGAGGLDEVSLLGPTEVAEWTGSGVRTFRVGPEDAGLAPCRPEDLAGGDAAENARILEAVLSGEPGPRREMVLLNAGAAIHLAGKAPGLREGVRAAAEAVDSGAALAKLRALAGWRG
ncbi:anthranilate phosphoribosyltransferase [Dissulfurirhabdus thermomarina]|uniref:Anthranilate phosphoribosyltransferase n=1 Tax=Dissulfurirhabdus thermomarina TaxID=1765737 RepID=A0A6N9TN99_DISTH|nr:anthranilate phosphoribosyltransferase [Dissulfurirhabdus thermomarina]NDY42518.1 anthranilate phosphoribosyltransferase [Dissulfurirhabdus thermomarina]NMX24205.1 anthranilate phosphoribosyltransferase [Dissulfurirhabdus thermomarina]